MKKDMPNMHHFFPNDDPNMTFYLHPLQQKWPAALGQSAEKRERYPFTGSTDRPIDDTHIHTGESLQRCEGEAELFSVMPQAMQS